MLNRLARRTFYGEVLVQGVALKLILKLLEHFVICRVLLYRLNEGSSGKHQQFSESRSHIFFDRRLPRNEAKNSEALSTSNSRNVRGELFFPFVLHDDLDLA